jgi:hypothetical protein
MPQTGPDHFRDNMKAKGFWESKQSNVGRPGRMETREKGRPAKRKAIRMSSDGSLPVSAAKAVKRSSKARLTVRGKQVRW